MRFKKLVAKKRETLVELKPSVFEALSIASSPRTEKVFDLAVSLVVWSLVDGAHMKETVLPFLIKTMKMHLDQGAYGELA